MCRWLPCCGTGFINSNCPLLEGNRKVQSSVFPLSCDEAVTTSSQFIINDILHDMSFLLLAHIENGISQGNVGEVRLRERIDVLLPFNVVTCCLIHQE